VKANGERGQRSQLRDVRDLLAWAESAPTDELWIPLLHLLDQTARLAEEQGADEVLRSLALTYKLALEGAAKCGVVAPDMLSQQRAWLASSLETHFGLRPPKPVPENN
jgi:hypothetical protein